MLATKENWEDVKKYYQGTILKFHSEKENLGDRLWKITNVTSNRIEAEDSAGDAIYVDLKYPYKLNYAIPKATVYQYQNRAAYLYRIPARMWRKGIDIKNTKIEVLCADGQWRGIELQFASLQGFVDKPGYYTLKEALDGFAIDLESAALSSRISLSCKGGVYINQTLVGRYQADKQTLTAKGIFVSDLVKYFPNTLVKSL